MHPHLIDLNDYSVDEWTEIIELGEKIRANPSAFSHECDGKIMATLFYEPSTRTQMSFQTAMLRLGGTFIGFDNPASSSVAKGENLKDTTKVVSSYADILVMRHPNPGAPRAAALTAECPVINAGDGGHLHPTQTLTDLLTLKIEKGRLENLTVGVCGDLLNGRTVHSLCKAMSCYPNNRFVLISTKKLRLPEYIKNFITAHGSSYEEMTSIEEAIGKLDVIYMTRIQKERFESYGDYHAQKNVFILDAEKMKNGKKDMTVMHPLPRVDEIAVEVDSDPRAVYFRQAKYGMYVRMALILKTFENENTAPVLKGNIQSGKKCRNEKCITNQEKYLVKSFFFDDCGVPLKCEYCDENC